MKTFNFSIKGEGVRLDLSVPERDFRELTDEQLALRFFIPAVNNLRAEIGKRFIRQE